ncbi:ATP-dependent DNA helicase RecG [Desulfitobacterium metallireducens]|uniref:ATP-dependent DNA helicase RecG n=1 Tax=Desulfitobacterium metallireducens DSM 15288 TaxID=871968 RepID=W0EEI6_9FIRM|nr:ATP-dependent DNA helicase RecG [Desulfitobacterium metallireducens]AHF07624.1 ATP-dependent DNA helicase RecG [Desulfitobacterium metallireducens DSM 15288]
MISSQEKLVLQNLKRAIVAEEKQGCSDTGVVGGFHFFLTGILRRLEQLAPNNDRQILTTIAQNYAALSPLQRREALAHLRRFIDNVNLSSSDSSELKRNPMTSEESNREASPQKELAPEKLNPVEGVPVKDVLEKPISIKPKSEPKEHSLQYLKGVGPERAKQLEHLGVQTDKDLLLYFPRRYENRRLLRIEELKDGELATVSGKVVSGQITKARMKIVKLSIEQDGHLFTAVWFNQTFILKQFPVGTLVTVTGKVRWQKRVPELQATDIIKTGTGTPPEIIPIYSETARLSSKVIRNLVRGVISQVPTYFPEVFPQEFQIGLDRPQAYREIHFPSSFQRLGQARERIVFEEVLFLQLAVARLRQGVEREESPILTGGQTLVEDFVKGLPFELTTAQKRVIHEIFRDMESSKGMTRLVQGDVGSGKTAVAMAALLKAVGSGYQGAMMAPTEILALQHVQSLREAFRPLGIRVVCLLGGQTRSEREKVLEEIAEGTAQIVVGTHAIIQETVVFKALGLAVTDEQHRFGVKQRTMLQSKGQNPHVLVMTATPIPRTLALTLYGDLQLSALDEMPKGRKPIITRKLSERGRSNLEKFLEEEMEKGHQIYVVCPLVDESEHMDFISATERYESLCQRFPHRNVALLHGRMKGPEKEAVMQNFQAGETDILVSTTVVEVGVNVPNASVMVIENAERFGLAQLHQLRGRVGRGSEQSFCILMSSVKDSRRLEVLCETQDGFKIAEEDLKLRGAGEILGTRQHGVMELRLANLSQDARIVEQAYQVAQKILAHPQDYEELWREVDKYYSLDNVGLH